MVIHDMRNPTTSIQYGVTEVLMILNKYFIQLKTMMENIEIDDKILCKK